MTDKARRAELAALVIEQVGEMGPEERAQASAEYLAACARLGVKVARVKRVADRTARVDAVGIDAEIERLVDAAGIEPTLADAVKELVAGGSLRPTARKAGLSHQGLCNVATRILGEPPAAVVARFASKRLRSRRERIVRQCNAEGLRLPMLALAQ